MASRHRCRSMRATMTQVKALFSSEMPLLNKITLFMPPRKDATDELLELSKHVKTLRTFEFYGDVLSVSGFEAIWGGAPVLQSVLLRFHMNLLEKHSDYRTYFEEAICAFLDYPTLHHLKVPNMLGLMDQSEKIPNKCRRLQLTNNNQLYVEDKDRFVPILDDKCCKSIRQRCFKHENARTLFPEGGYGKSSSQCFKAILAAFETSLCRNGS